MTVLRSLQASILILGLAATSYAVVQSGPMKDQSGKQAPTNEQTQQATTPVTPQPAKMQPHTAPAQNSVSKPINGKTNTSGATGEATKDRAAANETAPATAVPAMSEAEALPQGTPFVPDLNLFGPSTAELHQRLATALRNDPNLAGSNIVANVSDDTISLTGSVRTAKDRVTARRIAESFASNRKVKEKITVAGSAARNNAGEAASESNPPKNQKSPATSNGQKPESPNRPLADPANPQEKPKTGE